jgi:hypothetical protein
MGGDSFFMLAAYVAAEAIETSTEGAVAETAWLGIALTAGTLALCPWFGRAKQRIVNSSARTPFKEPLNKSISTRPRFDLYEQ